MRAARTAPRNSATNRAPIADTAATRRSSGSTASSSPRERENRTVPAPGSGAPTTRRPPVAARTKRGRLSKAPFRATSTSAAVVTVSSVEPVSAPSSVTITTPDRVRLASKAAARSSKGLASPAAPTHLPARCTGASATRWIMPPERCDATGILPDRVSATRAESIAGPDQLAPSGPTTTGSFPPSEDRATSTVCSAPARSEVARAWASPGTCENSFACIIIASDDAAMRSARMRGVSARSDRARSSSAAPSLRSSTMLAGTKPASIATASAPRIARCRLISERVFTEEILALLQSGRTRPSIAKMRQRAASPTVLAGSPATPGTKLSVPVGSSTRKAFMDPVPVCT